ncbi:MAG: dihydroorotate dehydrogenase electron transfer subunit [Thermoplasmata archaeon]
MSLDRVMIVSRLVENRHIARGCHDLLFSGELKASPGQFVMIWIPGSDEIPMSISRLEPGGIGLTVKIAGEATKALSSLRKGDRVRIRGAYGRPFDIKGRNAVLVAGGIGAAPLLFLANTMRDKNIKATVILGARTEKEIPLQKEFERLGFETLFSTDDGSKGFCGTASDCFRNEIASGRDFDAVYCCGPEAMISDVCEIASRKGLWGQAALERYMKCAIGICGACAINDKLVCRDGPVFDFSQLQHLSEFGKCKRDASGRARAIV